jgi:NAD-dependent deacetylase
MDKKRQFQDIIEKSNNIVFFGGAGVSTESNIPDFRSVDGLYNTKYKFPPETILSHTFFMEHTEEFFRFYRDKMIIPYARPNITHKKLAELEEENKLKAIVTQNIDGLHEMAGSKNVLNLHGTIYKNHCINCGKSYPMEFIKESTGIPHCEKCGGIVKPDVVLYEENLDETVLEKSVNAIADAETLIVGGTSLMVYPAAGLINYFNGKHLILINKEQTRYDNMADLVFYESIGEMFKLI